MEEDELAGSQAPADNFKANREMALALAGMNNEEESFKLADEMEEMATELEQVQAYKRLHDQYSEQSKTVNFQKAKIAALQSELEEALKAVSEKDSELIDAEKGASMKGEVDKKSSDKINSLQSQVAKLKIQLSDKEARIVAFEKALQDQTKELDAGEREKRRQ